MEWINVEEEYPAPVWGSIYSDCVLAINDEEAIYTAVYIHKFDSWCKDEEAPNGELFNITHWMPLPKPPVKDCEVL